MWPHGHGKGRGCLCGSFCDGIICYCLHYSYASVSVLTFVANDKCTTFGENINVTNSREGNLHVFVAARFLLAPVFGEITSCVL